MKYASILFSLAALAVVLILQGAPASAQPPVPYFNYTADNSTCNGDGTMMVNSFAEWAQYDGTIQTLERNPAQDPGGEQIIRGPAGDDVSGPTQWNFLPWTLEADDTAFEIVRGRDGATLGAPLIYAVRVDYSCAGLGSGQPAVVTYTITDPEPEAEETEAEPVPGCDVTITIPSTAVGATITAETPVYWQPDAVSDETFPAGLNVRAIGVDASGAYTKVLFACGTYWVPTSVIGPNYDAPWNGAPLPTAVVE